MYWSSQARATNNLSSLSVMSQFICVSQNSGFLIMFPFKREEMTCIVWGSPMFKPSNLPKWTIPDGISPIMEMHFVKGLFSPLSIIGILDSDTSGPSQPILDSLHCVFPGHMNHLFQPSFLEKKDSTKNHNWRYIVLI